MTLFLCHSEPAGEESVPPEDGCFLREYDREGANKSNWQATSLYIQRRKIMQGTIVRIVPEQGFGFIDSGGREFFFHRSALLGVDFKELAPGVVVEFVVDRDPHGDEPGEHPRAVSIRLAEGAIPAVD